jgi:8-oxo-dGTP pyrophosphatase MutT (NUDIX family)
MGRTAWEDLERGLAARPPARIADRVRSRAAVAMVLREAASGLELLLIQRAEHPNDPWSGQMAFPGGRAEPADGDLRATAVRETTEELGLDLAVDGECLGALDEVRAMARMRPLNLTIQPFVFRLLRDPGELRLNSEVRSAHWLPLDTLRDPARRGTLDYLHDDIVLDFPCLRIGELTIWGLTFRMLSNLLVALSAADSNTDLRP